MIRTITWGILIHVPAFHFSPRGHAVQHRGTELHRQYKQLLNSERNTIVLPPLPKHLWHLVDPPKKAIVVESVKEVVHVTAGLTG